VIYTVGLTGGIGSGKSTVADQFSDLGVCVVDTDLISHSLTSAGQPALTLIRQQLGADYLLPNGTLDRDRLRQRVFADQETRRELETIVHPLIHREVLRQLAESNGPYALLVVPLLIEKRGYRDLLQRILVVDCPEEIQVARTMARSRLSAEQVRAIMAAQATRSARLSEADDVIDSSGDRAAMRGQVESLHALYERLARDA
jgi:dephospho-CoA kinase